MFIQEIAFANIDLENEAFRISEDLDPSSMMESLREIGQLNPVVLLERKACTIVVCGFRRIRALKRLGKAGVLARILLEGECDPVRVMHLAMWDNLSHRQLNPLENARVLSKLHDDFGIPDQQLIRDYLPLLGLSPAEPVLQSYLRLHSIHPALRQCFSDGRLTQASIDTLSRMAAPVQDRIATLMMKIRLSASFQKKFLALLEELHAVSGDQPNSLLDRPEIAAILDDPRLSSFQRGEGIFELMYRLRNPHLAQATEQFLSKKKRLGLPGSIRISAHPYFEEPGLRVEFDAPDPKRFRALAAALHESAESPDFAGLFRIDSETQRIEEDDSI